MEVILTSSTKFKVALSEKKFNVSATSEISRFSSRAKVTKKGEPIEIKPGLMKQNHTIADASGYAQLNLWQDDINKLTVGETYEYDGLIVRSFNGSKFWTPPKSGWSLVLNKCDNIVVDDDIENKMLNAYVTGVMHIEIRVSCLSSKATFTVPTGNVGKCTRCSMSQHINRCPHHLQAKSLITMEDNSESHTLSANIPMIRAITKNDNINEESDINEVTIQLLEADNFDLTHQDGLINSVTRS